MHAGFAVAFFDLLADSATPEQQTRFCKSVLDAWESAQHHTAPSQWESLNPFCRRGRASQFPANSACTLCLCLTAFGPGRIQQVLRLVSHMKCMQLHIVV